MDTDWTKVSNLDRDLAAVLNYYSAENASNTPDFILAQYLLACLAAWNTGVQQRETWYGRDARPGHITSSESNAVTDTTGRPIAPPQTEPAPRPDGPWRDNHNTTGE